MLVIRDEQWRAFEDNTQQRFVDRVVAEVSATWPGACAPLGKGGVIRRVEAAIAEAEGHQIRLQDNQCRFVHLSFLIGEDFATSTWAARILGWPEADERLKLAALEKRAEIESERGA